MAARIAHMNFGVLKADWGQPEVAGFTDNVDAVNRAADRSEGFIARPDGPDVLAYHLFGRGIEGASVARMALTMSLWETPEALEAFVHRTIHGKFLDRRAEWFLPLDRRSYVIWPIAGEHVPDLHEARAALDRLEAEGPSDLAYDFTYLKARGAAA